MRHRMRFAPVIVLLALSLACSFAVDVNAQALPSSAPGKVGISAERIVRIDRLLEQYVADGKVAGVVALAARHGKVFYSKSFGMADIEAGKPMQADTMFRICSMSKAITTTAAMILYEEGRFLLSDPVSKYIPEFSGSVVIEPSSTGTTYALVPAKRDIAIRHLMNHTSGITYGDGLQRELYAKAGMTVGLTPTEGSIGEMILRLADLPLISHPGDELHYGMSIDALGYLIEVISGRTLDVFMRERIFEPLGMKDTYFVLPREKLPRLAILYGKDKGGALVRDSVDPEYLCTQTYFSGGAGLVSTAPDYLRFAQMILNGGELDGVRILGKKTVELMSENSIGDLYAPFRIHSGDKFGYGFGIRTERGEYDELESLGILGWDGAFYTRFWIDPKEDLVAVFMTQSRDWSLDLINKYRVLVYQAVVDK